MYRLRVDPAPEIRVCEPFGSFEVYKDYTVVSNVKLKPKTKLKPRASYGISGIVVQCVEKTTSVKDANNILHDTTESINTFTSGKVPFSNDKYLEYFTVNNAISIEADSFSTGPIVKYDQDGPQTYTTDDPEYNTYKTEGTITMVGENWFISADNVKYNEVLEMGWVVQTETSINPANGLNYMPFSQEAYNKLKDCIDSNIITHTVVTEWTFDDPYTVVTSSLKEIIISTKKAEKVAVSLKSAKSKAKPKGKSKKRGGGRHKCCTRRVKIKRVK